MNKMGSTTSQIENDLEVSRLYCCICLARYRLEPESRLYLILANKCEGFVHSLDGFYSVDYVMAVLLINLVTSNQIKYNKFHCQYYVETDEDFVDLFPYGIRTYPLANLRHYVEQELGHDDCKVQSLICCPGPALDYLLLFKPPLMDDHKWCYQYCSSWRPLVLILTL